jgi:hypothetical protein
LRSSHDPRFLSHRKLIEFLKCGLEEVKKKVSQIENSPNWEHSYYGQLGTDETLSYPETFFNFFQKLPVATENKKVEPERIELSSREDDTVLSTCLVDFTCREQQGSQQPKLLLSRCVLAVLSNLARSSSAKRHR